MDDLDREVRAEIEAEYQAEYGRKPDAHAYWIRYFAHPRVLAKTASVMYDLMVMKVQWQQWQAAEEKKK